MQAIVAGTSLLRSILFKNWDEFVVETPYSNVSVSRASQYLFLQRHGKKGVPPHMIDHRANIWALKSLDVEGIIAVNSVGSLKSSLKPGTCIIPDDFISPWNIPTFLTMRCVSRSPSWMPPTRRECTPSAPRWKWRQ